MSDGRVLWEQADFGMAHCIATKEDVLAIGIQGKVSRFAVNESQYVERGEFNLPSAGVYRALPALADGVLYCRSTDRQRGALIAVRVK